MPTKKTAASLIWGIILIVIGVIFLLDIDIWYIIAHFWPVILILWGAWKLYVGILEHKREPGEPRVEP